MTKFSLIALAFGIMATGASVATPSSAGQSELELLSQYTGQWSGSAALVGGPKPEPFNCRLSVTKGNQAKINYAGRCSLASMNLSITGTIAYDDGTRTYQAVMGSNAGYKGVAVGRVNGDTITFDLAENESDRAGNMVKLGARIILIGTDSITVDYRVEFNDSGTVLTASVPFNR
jgi:hypothetical protein